MAYEWNIGLKWANEALSGRMKHHAINGILWLFDLICGLGSDYMITACRDEISTCPPGTYFIIRLHGGIKFLTAKVGQIFAWCFFRFACIFNFFSLQACVN